jgi:hypothetical protein
MSRVSSRLVNPTDFYLGLIENNIVSEGEADDVVDTSTVEISA